MAENEQFARLENDKRNVRLCLFKNGNLRVEEYLQKDQIGSDGRKAIEPGWYNLWTQHIAEPAMIGVHFREH